MVADRRGRWPARLCQPGAVRRRTLPLLLAALGAAAALTTACSTGAGDGAGPAATTAVPPEGSAPPATTAPQYRADLDLGARLAAAGVPLLPAGADFYAVPDPLPPGEPGDLVWVEAVERSGLEGADTVRVMYHTRDRQDRDIAATGLVAVPHTAPPPGGRRILAWGHGTSGMAPQCAPSRDVTGFNRRYVDQGYIVTAADYPGLGPNGQRHAYLSGVPEGRSIVDLTRAVGHLGIADPGPSWVAFGHSQGGHAVLFAAEQLATYAPESDLLGVVAMAPVGDLANLVPYASSPIRGVGVMIVLGLAVDHPELRPEEFLTDKTLALSGIVDTGCNGDIAEVYRHGFEANDLLRADPGVYEPAASILRENNPGQVRTDVPVLIVHGGQDWIVPPGRSEQIFESQCALGMVVEREVYDTADHLTILDAARDDVEAWIDARFRGEPATDACPGGAGTTTGTGTGTTVR